MVAVTDAHCTMHQFTNAHVTCVAKVAGDVGEMPVGVHTVCAWLQGWEHMCVCVCGRGGGGEEWYV